MIVDDGYAYVTLRSGSECQGFTNQLEVINISDLTNPDVEHVSPMSNPYGLGKDGNALFICDGADGLKIYDTSDITKLDDYMVAHYRNIQAFDIIPYHKTAMMNTIRLKNRNAVDLKTLKQINAVNNRQNDKFIYTVTAGGLFDDSGNSNSFRGSATVNIIYRIKQDLQFGIGTNISSYDRFTAVPIYFQYQGDLSYNNQQSFYYYGGIGIASAWKKEGCNCNFQEVDGKHMIKAGLGYRWQVESIQLNFTIGWIQQRLRAEYNYGEFQDFGSSVPTVIRQSLNGTEMMVGVIF